MARRKEAARNWALRSAIIETLEDRRLMAFGLTTTTANYLIDTGAGVTFTILRQGSSSTIHSGDMTSTKLNGVEFQAPYSVSSRYSHFESGLSNTSVITATVDPNPTPQWILISCDDTTATTGAGGTGVIQYYIAKRDDPNIYMATYAPEMKVSSTRFIAYFDGSKFTNRPDESDTSGNTGGIETADVQGHADGTTTSKYYGETRNIDHLYHGATGNGVGAFMFIGNRERGAGGPFWKDIDWQSGSSVEIYNMPYSGHSLTDAFRPGLHGPYALHLTNGSAPTVLPNYSFLDGVGLTGWVGPAGRGTISGRASGVAAGKVVTVGLSNTAAQFWTNPDANGNYTISGVLPGTYTESIYDEELVVGQRTVTITAGQTTRADIAATAFFGLSGSNNVFSSYNANATPIWRIGKWDGTPREFLNGDKTTVMHPSDARMSAWADSTGVTNFKIGTNVDSEWPMAEWKTQVGVAPYVDTKNRITFTLNSTQRAQGLTLRIGITRSDSERPGVSANGGTTAFGVIVTQAEARGLSLGNWRGNNAVYSYSFAANSLIVGTNTFDIYAISGSTFTGYFAGYHIYDAVDLIPTSQAAVPTITSLTVSPGTGANIRTNGTRKYTALGNGTLPVNAVWTTTIGSINDAGEFIAPAAAGSGTITATYGTVVQNIAVNVTTTAPSIATAASAGPNPTYNLSTTLNALGADDNGEAALTYTWAINGTQPGTVTFGAGNGTNAGKSITANFSAYGNYSLQCTITDASGNTAVSFVNVAAQDIKNWYKFDQPNGSGLTDYSGNTQYGNAFGKFSFPTGVSKGALNFNGGGATLPTGIVAGLNDFTIAAWVKSDSLNNWSRIFDFGTGTTNYMYLASRAGTTGNPIRFAITTSGGAGEQAINGPTLANGVWTHLAVTLSGNTATLYVNGVASGTNTGVTLRPSSLGNTNYNLLGESQYSADPAFAGSIDDFRIYGRALNGSELSTLATKPTVATAAAATPAPVTGATTTLSVLGADALSGEASLTYTWALQGNFPAGLVSFSANGTNASKNTVATFTAAGTYNFLVTITNPNGLSITSSVTVVVNQTLTSVTLSPTPVTVVSAGSQQFTATAFDQFADALVTQPTFTWSKTSGVGSIDTTGLYTASGAAGSAVIRATNGLVFGSASITVTNAAPTVVNAAAATPSAVTATTTSLSALGDDTDGGGQASLIYTWSLTGVPPAAVTYSTNGNNSAQNTTATFTKAGTYNFLVTITDAGGLTTTSSVSVVVSQTLTSVVVTPGTASLGLNATQQFTASARDQFGNALTSQPAFTWSKTSGVGSISAGGLYSSLTTPGNAVISATTSSISGLASINVTNSSPTVATAAAASPSPVNGTTTTLSVLGADDGGEANLTYTWSVTAKPSGAVNPIFSANSTNAAKSSIATFSKAGSYTFLVTITDSSAVSITSSVSVVVNQTLTTIVVTPSSVTLSPLATQQYSAIANDQFANVMTSQPSFTWAKASGVGSISASGLYTAPAGSGAATITASSGAVTSAASTITISNAAPTVATPASASPNTVTSAITSALSVLGTDDGGEANLIYTWSLTGTPPAAVTYSANGTNASKNTTVTFTQAGIYNFLVTIADAFGSSVTSPVNVTVSAGPFTFNGSSGADNYRVTANGTFDEIYLNNFLVQTINRSLITSLTINGLAGNDSLIIDYSSGDPTPTSGIIFNGGGDTDTLDVRGTGSSDAFAFNSITTVNHGSAISSYTGVEAVNVSLGNFSVNANLGAIDFTASGGSTFSTFTKDQSFASLIVSNGASVTSASTNALAAAMVIGGVTIDNATLAIAANGGLSGVSQFNSLTLSGSGRLELHDNDLVINYGANSSPASQLQAQVMSGLTLLGGAGSSGITSVDVDTQTLSGTILAVVDDGVIAGGITSTSGFNLTNPTTSVIIKYTWFGDSNFDGLVDGGDYALLDTGFTSGGTLTGWVFGDYTFDGVIDDSDYALIDTGFIAQDRVL